MSSCSLPASRFSKLELSCWNSSWTGWTGVNFDTKRWRLAKKIFGEWNDVLMFSSLEHFFQRTLALNVSTSLCCWHLMMAPATLHWPLQNLSTAWATTSVAVSCVVWCFSYVAFFMLSQLEFEILSLFFSNMPPSSNPAWTISFVARDIHDILTPLTMAGKLMMELFGK